MILQDHLAARLTALMNEQERLLIILRDSRRRDMEVLKQSDGSMQPDLLSPT
jgi:hypothetical protein